jgi:predicted DNA-binding transcriptional regulator
MEKDKLAGAGILLASIVVAIIYALLLYFGHGSILAVILVSAAFFALLGVIGWIGWTMATTPSPKPVEVKSPSEVEGVVKKRRRGRPKKRAA